MDRPERNRLDESQFIRHRIYGGKGSPLRRYAELVLARPAFWSLLRYELLTTLLGPVPGALGMALRGALWRSLFPVIGRKVVFGCRVTLRHPERIRLGDGVILDDDTLIDGRGAGDEGVVLGDRVIVNRGAAIQAKVGGISIGADSSVGAGCKVISQGPIRIAENVSLAGGSMVAGGRYVVERTGATETEKERFTGGEIRIGRNVRVGMNAMIQDGVTVGEGAIIAPASVVLSDVPAQTVVSGFPARPWRERKAGGEPAPASPAPASAGGTVPGPAAAGIAAQVRTYLEEVRFADFAEGELSEADSLFDHDILDSLSLVALVAWLEKTFDVDIGDEDLVPENLDSVERIARFVAARRGTNGAP